VHDRGGKRHEVVFTPGKKHLLRLVNTGSEVTFRFGIDKHKMTVVAMDFVPIIPYETSTILLAVGQRYDVIVEADQVAGSYWARAVPMLTCFAINLMSQNVRAIVRYDSSSTGEPSSLGHVMLDTCRDEDLACLMPHIPHSVGASAMTQAFTALPLPNTNDSLALRWQVGGPIPYKSPKDSPVSDRILSTPLFDQLDISSSFVPIDLTALPKHSWVYIVVESFLPLPHPLHLHGHDTYVLARGGGPYLDSLIELETINPPRRDTVNLPQNGFLVLAFETDNPGAWILHCHIEWHLHDGFAMSMLEGRIG